MLYYNTVNNILKKSLFTLMNSKEFKSFRLVGGTALSLQLGHRISVDIDLFSDVPYGSLDFNSIEVYLKKNFPYVDYLKGFQTAIGKSYFIGNDKEDAIKLDVFYTDSFIQPALIEDLVRLATIEEIIAMKIDVIQRGGRKKDFWDLHELLPKYDINTMLKLHKLRYEYSHDRELILQNMTNFTIADNDFDPKCLRDKYWEFIKEDIQDVITQYQTKNK